MKTHKPPSAQPHEIPLPAPGAILLKAGQGIAHPDVWEIPGGAGSVWKTYRRRPYFERATLGRWLAAREARVLRQLEGLPGVPRLVGRPDPFTVAMSRLDAEPVPTRPRGAMKEPLYFDRLWDLLQTMHARGLTHGDIRKKNILRSAADPSEPMLVDFTQSLVVAPGSGWPWRSLLARAQRVDRIKFLECKAWLLESGLTPAEQTELDRLSDWATYLGKWLRREVYGRLRGRRPKKRKPKQATPKK